MIASSRNRAFASSGVISGSGLAIANTIGRGAMPFTISPLRSPPTERPMNMAFLDEGIAEGKTCARLCPLLLGLREILSLARDDAPGVTHRDVVVLDAHEDEQSCGSDCCCTRAVQDDGDVFKLRARSSRTALKARRSDHRRAVLVVMEDKDVELRLQTLLNLKALVLGYLQG